MADTKSSLVKKSEETQMISALAHNGRRWFGSFRQQVTDIGDHQALIDYLSDSRLDIVCRDHHALIGLTVWLACHCIVNKLELPKVSARGSTLGLEFGGLCWRKWKIHTGGSGISDPAGARAAGPRPHGSPEQALWSELVKDRWTECINDLGLKPRTSAATTALGLLPANWIRASKRLGASEPWQEIRQAYYGGRVQCFQKYSGHAVEHDLKNAYGSAMVGCFGYLPDWKVYEGRPRWCRQPGWFDATIKVREGCQFAPLPRRNPDRPWQILWPKHGSWRGWYCWHELQSPDVQILKVHKAHSGRWDHVLHQPVRSLLERSLDPFAKAVAKQLVVSFAGKLAQVPVGWRIWSPTDDWSLCPTTVYTFHAPEGGSIDLYQSTPTHVSPSFLPQVASYITARTRCELRDNLNRAGQSAIYCDTDSIHHTDDWTPPNEGNALGQWTKKESGHARYFGRRHYFIGSKRVGC